MDHSNNTKAKPNAEKIEIPKENDSQTPRPKPAIYYGKESPTTEHPSAKHWNRPYPPGNLWARGIDKNGEICWV